MMSTHGIGMLANMRFHSQSGNLFSSLYTTCPIHPYNTLSCYSNRF